MNVNDAFAGRLKLLREEKGLSQAQMADTLGISRGSISYYENAERTPDINTLAIIKEYFNVSFDYLLGYSSLKTESTDESAPTLPPRIADTLRAVENALIKAKDELIPGRLGVVYEELDYLTEDLVNIVNAYAECLNKAYFISTNEQITKDFLSKLNNNHAPAIITLAYRNCFSIPMTNRKPAKKKKGLFG